MSVDRSVLQDSKVCIVELVLLGHRVLFGPSLKETERTLFYGFGIGSG